jgi:diguanylate cyclase (GGDEF)-like protein
VRGHRALVHPRPPTLKRAVVKADAVTMQGGSLDASFSESQDSEREIACSMTAVLLRLVRSSCGEAGVAEVLQGAGAKYDVAYLEGSDNWVSLAEATALLHAGAQRTGDPHIARRVGEQILRQHAGTQVATVLRSLGSTEAVLHTVTLTAAKLSAVTKMESLEARPGRAVVRALARDGFTRLPVHCELTAGLLSASPMLFGLPLARVEEAECQTRGDEHCLYTVSWDAELAAAAADPQQRVTALEAQLLAVTERLQSAYATAGDLISAEDLDTLLRRIVERAANTVRAPSHILAVRTEPSAELQVYGHGIDDDKASALARAVLAGERAGEEASAEVGEAASGVAAVSASGESMLVVEVSSSRRRYGRLIARYPGAATFFPQEEELLTVYAKHAAAVLDMATALAESARRHDEVSSLLALSQALSHARTANEVAERLALAVPEVVDCDHIGVWLWDDSEQNLRSAAAWGRTAVQDGLRSGGIAISPERSPSLRSLIESRDPQYFELSTHDTFVSELMSALEVVAVAAVPIVARETFLGALTVSVAERPERLRLDEELLGRLSGVAALAATAVENGRLLDTLRYRASHDGLTGLLNRVGFRAHIDALLDFVRPHNGQIGLLFIDLDDFKEVNDSFGHAAGDEVIRKAAARLGAVTRASDAVARVGGDEFAVVLADIEDDAHVRSAEVRVRMAFVEPFVVGGEQISLSASVGGGLWPEHGPTVTELVRHADAAMYADKARRRPQTPA